MSKTCLAYHALTGEAVRVSFEAAIECVEPVLGASAAPREESALYVAPAWIDIQINGFAGVDYNDPSTRPEDFERSLKSLFSLGVGRIFPTVITGPPERMRAALRTLAGFRRQLPEGCAVEGFHVEGPHISPEDGPRGAHPKRWVRPPDIDEFRRWQEAAEGDVRVVTLAPEWPGAASYIERLVQEGVVVAIGHTMATTAQIQDAVRAGATLSTHLGNGAEPFVRRHPNYLWDQLAEDRLAASFIVDGFHLDANFLRVALRAKGIERSVLVTDAVMPAGCPPGDYRLGEIEVRLLGDGRVVLTGAQRLAGSALKMNHAMELVMRTAGVSLRDAVTMATRNPARVGRIWGRQRGLEPGERADLVLFEFDPEDQRIQVRETWLGGRLVYKA